MSLQIFLRGKLLGIDSFLAAPVTSESEFIGRSNWTGLLTEVLPRALLAELGLAQILLGSSGGDEFLLVLPADDREKSEAFLAAAAAGVASNSGSHLRLIWAITENLGDWSDIRKRLNEDLGARAGTPGFEAAVPDAPTSFAELSGKLRTATSIGWSPSHPATIEADAGTHTWPIDAGLDSILFPRHHAPEGVRTTGVLRGDVDDFGIRLRRLQSIEEHLQLSLTYKQFFAGELKLLCSMGGFWQKVSILYSGGDDFAVYGEWDGLLTLARDLQRVFNRFAEENLKELPGPEGKTMSMAMAVDPTGGSSCQTLFEEAGRNLEFAKNEDKDCIYALGRILEWKQLADASDLKTDLVRMVADFRASPEYLDELCGLYRETAGTRAGKRSRASERPWRYHRKLNRILPTPRAREGQKVRQDLIAGFVGKNPANAKLRPSGRVALEWARLSQQERE